VCCTRVSLSAIPHKASGEKQGKEDAWKVAPKRPSEERVSAMWRESVFYAHLECRGGILCLSHVFCCGFGVALPSPSEKARTREEHSKSPVWVIVEHKI